MQCSHRLMKLASVVVGGGDALSVSVSVNAGPRGGHIGKGEIAGSEGGCPGSFLTSLAAQHSTPG